MAKQNTLESVNNRIVDDDEEFADGYLMRRKEDTSYGIIWSKEAHR